MLSKIKSLINTTKGSQDNKQALEGYSAILGMGHWAPEDSIEIADVEKQIKEKTGATLNLSKMVGIERYRVIKKGDTLIDMGMLAINQAIENTQQNIPDFKTSDIDLVIYCGVSREQLEPATAVYFHNKLNLKGATAFDVTDACLGMLDALLIADSFIATGRFRQILLISTEAGSAIAQIAMNHILAGENLRDHFPSLTLGDGAAAMIIGAPRNSKNGLLKLKYSLRETFSEYCDLCVIKDLYTPMHTDARKLFDAAISKYPNMLRKVTKACGWKIKEIDLYVPHQASKKAVEQGAREFGVGIERVCFSIVDYGNMASAAVPFTLSQTLKRHGKLNKEKIMLAGFGSGLGVAIIALEHEFFKE